MGFDLINSLLLRQIVTGPSPTEKSLSRIAAVVGKCKLSQLTTTFAQVANMGKLMDTETIQFFESGIPICDLLADSMGKTREDVASLILNGGVFFEDVERAILKATELGGRYY